MPRAALHVHIEGTLEPELAFALAERNGIEPGTAAFPYRSADELRKAYAFSDLKSFLDVYYTASRVLLRKRDFYELAMAYCRKAISQNVRRAEVFFDPQSHTARGIPFATVADGIGEAFTEANGMGLSTGLIVSILRDAPVGTRDDPGDPGSGFSGTGKATAWATIKQAVRYNGTVTRAGSRIIGVGLDSNEVGFPPNLFTGVYAYARQHGLLCTAHAGEEGPAEYVWQVIRDLRCARIDHGVRSVEDPGLVAYLATPQDSPEIAKAYHGPHRIPATVCPLSNYELRVFPDPRTTNILTMLDMGIMATVNSDDPAYFRGYSTENYLALLAWLAPGNPSCRPITLADLFRLCLNGFEASWLPLQEKRRLIEEATRYFLQSPGTLYRSLSGTPAPGPTGGA
jgi:adenosine deaminase